MKVKLNRNRPRRLESLLWTVMNCKCFGASVVERKRGTSSHTGDDLDGIYVHTILWCIIIVIVGLSLFLL